uniref:Uncharacterized protein n=1 Tax=Mustela putorius furo TaxID=9669 RepID=M3XLQ5_MUSPF
MDLRLSSTPPLSSCGIPPAVQPPWASETSCPLYPSGWYNYTQQLCTVPGIRIPQAYWTPSVPRTLFCPLNPPSEAAHMPHLLCLLCHLIGYLGAQHSEVDLFPDGEIEF